ncbi:MAG: rRNA maturation RNase YbeY [Gammaproteobacteria bacterium]
MSIDLTVQIGADLSVRPSEAELITWVEAVLDPEHQDAALSIRFVDSEEMRQLNNQFRGKNKHTNVLSFPNSMPPELRDAYLGDIVICVPVIEIEATEQDKDPMAHYAHMLVHGILHLLGYDHQAEDDAKIMESIEVKILANLGYPDPYGV